MSWIEKLRASSAPLFALVHGEKGGVGKTLLAHAAVLTAREAGRRVRLIDGDAANADAYGAWKAEAEATDGSMLRRTLEMRSERAWAVLESDLASARAGDVVILDLPAGIHASTTELWPHLRPQGITCMTLWALDVGREPVRALARYLALSTEEPVTVARSVWRADRDEFTMFARAMSEVIEPRGLLRGGRVFDIGPLNLAARLAMSEGVEIEERPRFETLDDVIIGGPVRKLSLEAICAGGGLRGHRTAAWATPICEAIARAMVEAKA